MTGSDRSNGYEAVAEDFKALRATSPVGVATVRAWAETLPAGGDVLDLGCGHGLPVAQALVEAGLRVHGVDASPSLIAEFRARFPDAPAECGAVEESSFFDRTFDGAIAWGLMFLLEPEVQERLIRRVAAALEPGGRFLFTAPSQECRWPDLLTGRTSVSLGSSAYRQLVEAAGMSVVGEATDEGRNHYYFLRKEALRPQRDPSP